MTSRLLQWIRDHHIVIRTSSGEQIDVATIIPELYGSVTYIDASGRRLPDIPQEVDLLYNLEVANLSRNLLTFIPTALFRLKRLKELQISRNRIKEIPSEIVNLRSLRGLYASRNAIRYLPPELGLLSELTTLNVRNNLLTELPVDLFKLSYLDELDISENSIGTLPPEVAMLKRLRNLYVSGNDLLTLPECIGNLPLLESLAISGNQLTSLPQSICNLGGLKSFWVYDNPLMKPPLEIATRGIQDIRAYFYALDKGAGNLQKKSRILVLGPPRAGKTSLIERLVSDKFGLRRKETRGVKISKWQNPRTESETQLWDFGGQNHMHAAHRLFISGGEICLVVVDAGNTEELEYWLQLVTTTGSEVKAQVILNKVDLYQNSDVDRQMLSEKYHIIRAYHRVSCKTGEGISQLSSVLRDSVQQLLNARSSHLTVPVTWALASERLSQSSNTAISIEAYRKLCHNEGCTDTYEQEVLLNFLQSIGSVVILTKVSPWVVVSDPQWILDAVYSIISSAYARDATGFLPESAAFKILQEAGIYSNDECRLIIEILKEYDFAMILPNGMLLIPDLLPTLAPQRLQVPSEGVVHHTIKVDGDPIFLHARVLSRLSKDVVADMAWRRGATLRSADVTAEGVIIVDERDRELRIRCWGSDRISYLGYIRLIIRSVASAFGDVTLTELIPLHEIDTYVEYEEVLGLYLMGEKDICIGKAGVRRDVQALLFGVNNQGGRLLMNGPVFNFDRSAITFGSGKAMNINSGEMKSIVAQMVHDLQQSDKTGAQELAQDLSDAAVEGNTSRLKRVTERVLGLFDAAEPVARLATSLNSMITGG